MTGIGAGSIFTSQATQFTFLCLNTAFELNTHEICLNSKSKILDISE